jgi:hypothetical protein
MFAPRAVRGQPVVEDRRAGRAGAADRLDLAPFRVDLEQIRLPLPDAEFS